MLCIVFSCNKAYLGKFKKTYTELRTIGKYTGDVTLMICNDLDKDVLKRESLFDNINIVSFPKIHVPHPKYHCSRNRHKVDGCTNKFYLFHPYFKKWKYIFYIDCGVKIMADVSPMLKLCKKDTLLAHCDRLAFPRERINMILNCQFDKHKYPKIYQKLKKDYDLTCEYFQSTVMIYDTAIIKEDTLKNIIGLLYTYPIGVMNDQCYMSLYFIHVDKRWEQIPMGNDKTMFYDYFANNRKMPYIMKKE